MKKKATVIMRWLKYIKSYTRTCDKNVWVFGEWFGERCGDNCTYLANYVAKNLPHITVYWIAKENCNTEVLHRRIIVTIMGSSEAEKALSMAGVIFVNQGFVDVVPDGINVFANAVTVNLWHGVMWKKIGHDGDARSGLLFRAYCGILDPVQRTKYYIIPAETYGSHMSSAFGVPPKAFLRAGLPRNSVFYDEEKVAECRTRIEERTGIPRGAIIVAYLPTFRDKDASVADLAEIDKGGFGEYLRNNNVYILEKAHFVSQKRGVDINGSERVIRIDNIGATELLAAADVLITD